MTNSEFRDREAASARASGGRLPLLGLAFGLASAGAAALVLAASGRFLPHDERFLGMSAAELCSYDGCRVVHFMIHDRAAFGGVLIAIGLLYYGLAEIPLRAGAAWAWWTLLGSGGVGFASFLAYAGYGYLDYWHLTATLALLPCFAIGMIRTRHFRREFAGMANSELQLQIGSVEGMGRSCMLVGCVGATGAGCVILAVGMTSVFVPQDLEFLRVNIAELQSLNPRLVPLIAHDRAGFGGALVAAGSAAAACVAFGISSRSLWWVLAAAGLAGFGPAIAVHFAIGYTDVFHLAPAVIGAVLYAVGLVLTYPASFRRQGASDGEGNQQP